MGYLSSLKVLAYVPTYDHITLSMDMKRNTIYSAFFERSTEIKYERWILEQHRLK